MKPTKNRASLRSYLDDLPAHGDRPAFVLLTEYRKETRSYREVHANSLKVASWLDRLNVRKGDRLVLQAPNSPDWVEIFFGAVAQGVIVVPIDAGSSPEFLGAVCAKVAPKLVIAPAAPRGIGAADAGAAYTIEEAVAAAQYLSEFEEEVPLGGEDVAEIVFTSGTTAAPRGVVLRHKNLLANLIPLEHGYRERALWVNPLLPLRFVSVLPLSHMFGQLLGVFCSTVLASTTVFVTSLSSPAIVRAIKEDRIWALFTVPRFLKSLEEFVRREMERQGRTEDFEARFQRCAQGGLLRRIAVFRDVHAMLGWRFAGFVAGGAHLEPSVIEFWRRLGYVVMQGYGLTETSPVITVNNPFGASPYSVGRPIGDQEIKLAGDGEILVRGGNVMAGYYDDEAQTRAAFEDGWFKTGDIGDLDSTGHLHIKGRKKDVIVKEDGMNVFPEDIEARLNCDPAVQEAVVIGRAEAGSVAIHAVLLMRERSADPAQVVSRANGVLEPHQKIQSFSLWTGFDFPRTPTLKIKRADVAQAVAGTHEQAAGVGIEVRLQRLAASLAHGGEGVRADARLEDDLGLSSLDRLELATLLEDRFHVEVNEDLIRADTTVGDLKKLVGAEPEPVARLPFPAWPRRFPATWLRFVGQHGLGFPILSAFCEVESRFAHRLDRVEAPVLLVANHTSYLDVVAILRALPRRLRTRVAPSMTTEFFLAYLEREKHPARARWRHGLSANLLFLFGNAYFLPPTGAFKQTLRHTGRLVAERYCPLVFPEGGMTRTGRMAAFKPGIAVMVREMKIPVVPIHLAGLGEVLPPDTYFPRRRGRAIVSIGYPIHFSRESNAEILRTLEAEVLRLG